jgi:hypothetical protein
MATFNWTASLVATSTLAAIMLLAMGIVRAAVGGPRFHKLYNPTVRLLQMGLLLTVFYGFGFWGF